MVGKQWGLTPKVTSWIYTAVVRPMISYGAIVWVSALRKEKNIKQLTKLQQLACKMITSGIHSTPTAGMEVLLGLIPIEEYIQQIAVMTSNRLTKSGHWP